MPPVENRWTKKRKAEEEAAIVPAANVVVQFKSDAGEKAGKHCTGSRVLYPACRLILVIFSAFQELIAAGNCFRATAECPSGCHSQAIKSSAKPAS